MKIGLIGYGYWGGGFVARNIARVAELAAIIDPDPQRQEEAARVWGPWGTRTASEPAVAFEKCDAVWIAAPALDHKELVLQALMSNCHVVCEKPFVMHSEVADNLADLAEEHERVLMVGHLSLYTQQHREFKELFGSRVGKEVIIHVYRRTDRASLSDHSVLWGLGPHDVASLIDTFGMPDTVQFQGGLHRVTGEMRWGMTTAYIELDWLCSERSRRFSANNIEYSKYVDKIEPLLLEAQEFVLLCKTSSEAGRRYVHNQLARNVTQVLQRAEVSIIQGALT